MEVKIMHNSHNELYRKPFGAVPCGTAIRLRLDVLSGIPAALVELHIRVDDLRSEVKPMVYEQTEDGIAQYGIEIAVSSNPGLLWYFFRVVVEGAVYYYGNNHFSYGGIGEISAVVPPSYQITVYEKDAHGPCWFSDRIMYQIFVDRFFNGNQENKVMHSKKNSFIYANWDDKPCYIKDCETGGILRWDFFGGNLQGVMEKMDYLKSLGVDVIYLNPIFESPSNHKYDTGDYKNIDPMFGDNALFEEFCRLARESGIAIILDGVFSHTGWDSVYFNRFGNYPGIGAYQSEKSPYYSWYRFGENRDTYDCWWGIKSLPNVNEMDPGYLDYIISEKDSVLRHWLRLGAKGWRLDVADELPDEFIQRFKEAMRETDPESVLIGEVWEDASNKVSYGKRRAYFMGKELDGVMNYPFRNILVNFFTGKQSGLQTYQALFSQFENYPLENFYFNMNLIGSHDIPRILTVLGDAPAENAMTLAEKEAYQLPETQRQLGLMRLKLVSLIQMTFPGVPCIYYGDEAGVEGFRDPLNRSTYPWGREEVCLLSWYRKLTAIRKQYPVFRTGKWMPIYISEDVIGFMRLIQDDRDIFDQERPSNAAIVLVNRSNEKREEIFISTRDWCRSDVLYDLLEPGRIIHLENQMLKLQIGPLEGICLIEKL